MKQLKRKNIKAIDKSIATAVVNAVSKSQNKKTRKRRRVARRLNNTLNRVENAVIRSEIGAVKRRSFAKTFGISDGILLHGFEELAQTMFSGVSGIHRGLSLGLELTALCRFRQRINVTVPAGTNLAYAWAPSQLSSVNTFVYSAGTGAVNIQDPYNTNGTLNVTTTSIGGPFVVINPSNGWRTVRAAMTIVPTANVTSQGGYQMHAFAPNVYVGSPSQLTLTALPSGGSWTGPAGFDNFSMCTAYPGTTSVVLQYFPGCDGINVESSAFYGASDTESDGFIGYIRAATTTATEYTIQFDYGIEYIPNTNYRPYVDRDAPQISAPAYQELSKFVVKNWDKVIITDIVTHNNMVSQLEHTVAPLTTSYNMVNQVGDSSLYGPQKRLLHAMEEEKSYCEVIADGLGYDVCGAVGTATYNTGKQLLGAIIGSPNGQMLPAGYRHAIGL